jgi:hypothetical protein
MAINFATHTHRRRAEAHSRVPGRKWRCDRLRLRLRGAAGRAACWLKCQPVTLGSGPSLCRFSTPRKPLILRGPGFARVTVITTCRMRASEARILQVSVQGEHAAKAPRGSSVRRGAAAPRLSTILYISWERRWGAHVLPADRVRLDAAIVATMATFPQPKYRIGLHALQGRRHRPCSPNPSIRSWPISYS